MSRIDRIDAEILEALQNDARMSNKDLARHVGLAPSSCLDRVRRLVASGALKGSHADVDAETMGIQIQALIAVKLVRHSEAAVMSFHDHVLDLPEAIALYHVAGDQDFLVHVVARDAQHLRDLAMNAFTTRPEVAHLETSLVFEHVRKPALPLLRELRA